MVKEAETYAGCTLSETEWNDCKRSKGSHLVLNTEKLISCLENYNVGEDIFANARARQELDWTRMYQGSETGSTVSLLELKGK